MAEDEWWERHDEAVYDPALSHGLLYLCHQGCALREGLVVTGPARGQMWADDRADGGGLYPLTGGDGAPLGFVAWFRRWLDRAEQSPS
ncbi:hypothetical protein [Actinoplanes sp. NPDC051851]|uniref:hypothetical protein n=1 Tax=Actinoplanes sp. NPDC051851 TaxID=3154753 RepID=UPI00342C06CF